MLIRTCANGHHMSYLTYDELKAINPAYNQGVRCDLCHQHISSWHSQARIYHCGACNYDICHACSGNDGTTTAGASAGHYVPMDTFRSSYGSELGMR